MINISELLANAKFSTELYSPIFGPVHFNKIDGNIIYVTSCDGYRKAFDRYGRISIDENLSPECLLFPSKEVRTWEGWSLPKPHYDIANFKPFDKVLVRFCDGANWCCALFSHYCTRGNCHFVCSGGSVTQCIPFNKDTKHLLGTTYMPSEEFINW